MARRRGPIQLALGFVTAHPAVISALLGPRTVDHLTAQLAAADTVLPADVVDEMDAIVAPGPDLAPGEHDTPPRGSTRRCAAGGHAATVDHVLGRSTSSQSCSRA